MPSGIPAGFGSVANGASGETTRSRGGNSAPPRSRDCPRPAPTPYRRPPRKTPAENCSRKKPPRDPSGRSIERRSGFGAGVRAGVARVDARVHPRAFFHNPSEKPELIARAAALAANPSGGERRLADSALHQLLSQRFQIRGDTPQEFGALESRANRDTSEKPIPPIGPHSRYRLRWRSRYRGPNGSPAAASTEQNGPSALRLRENPIIDSTFASITGTAYPAQALRLQEAACQPIQSDGGVSGAGLPACREREARLRREAGLEARPTLERLRRRAGRASQEEISE